MNSRGAVARPITSVLVFTFLLAMMSTGCRPANVYFEPPPPEVPVISPRQERVTDYVDQTGTTQAVERVGLRSRVAGYLVEKCFNDGDVVKAGQTLFVIDEVPFQVRLRQAKARQSEAEVSLRQARQSKARETSHAKLKLSEADLNLAQTLLDRAKSLVERSALPQQDLDRTSAEYEKAKAKVASDHADTEQIDADYETKILSAQATLEAAIESVKAAELELSYCRVTSPTNGRIDARTYDVGNYIRAEDANPLATIVRLSPIYVNITPSAAELIRIKNAHSADSSVPITMFMGFDANRDFPFRGVVDYIAPTVDDSTGTVRVRGIFENPKEAIMPGLLVRVRLPAEVHENAILVPERAIGFDQAGSFIYIVGSDNKIERRLVTVGTTIGDERVVKGNVELTDQVVMDGLLRVRPGLTVVPKSVAPIDRTTTSQSASR